jgi:fused signal recognition particle receptor
MSDTTPGTPKLSWWRRLSSGLKRTSSSLGSAVADLVTKRKLDRAMLEDIEDVLGGRCRPLRQGDLGR